MDVLAFEAGPAASDRRVARATGAACACRSPLPAVALVMAGPERPRYPHPSRIAVAWNEGYVETWPAVELGVAEEQLAADAEMGGLVLGAERQRGQVMSGSPADGCDRTRRHPEQSQAALTERLRLK